MTDSKMALIGKLLRKAERAATQEEADSYNAKAETLAATYSIDMALARQEDARAHKRQVPTMRTIALGPKGQLMNLGRVYLFSAIAKSYNVTIDIAHNNTCVYCYGFATDIDVVEALYASLAVQMVASGDRHIRKREYAGTVFFDERTWEYKPVSGRRARQTFNLGFADRIGARIEERVATTQAEEIEIETVLAGTANTEIALRTAEIEVRDFYSKHSTARGKWKGTSVSRSGESYVRGQQAGADARIGSQTAIGGSRPQVTS